MTRASQSFSLSLSVGIILTTQILSGGCGNSDAPIPVLSTTAASRAYPAGFMIHSPLTSRTPSAVGKVLGVGSADKAQVISSLINGMKGQDCQVTLPSINGTGLPSCFAPALKKKDVSGQVSAIPSGELGIWNATESEGEACTSALVNAQLKNLGEKVDHALLLAGSMVCVMNSTGAALPEIHRVLDLTSAVNAAIQANNPGVSVSAAELTRLEDQGNRPVYQYSISSRIMTGGVPVSSTVQVRHVSLTADNSAFRGKVWAQINGIPGSSPGYAYSVSFEKGESLLSYKLSSANYGYHPSSVFDPNGNLLVGGSWTGHIAYGIVNQDLATGMSQIALGWQANPHDEVSRVLNVYTEKMGSQVQSCGFFGFGARFNTAAPTFPDLAIREFVCEQGKAGQESLAQKQCMTRGANGRFAPVPEKNRIAYAPVEGCAGAGMSFSTDGGLFYKALPAVGELVNIDSDPDYDRFVAPTSPTEL